MERKSRMICKGSEVAREHAPTAGAPLTTKDSRLVGHCSRSASRYAIRWLPLPRRETATRSCPVSEAPSFATTSERLWKGRSLPVAIIQRSEEDTYSPQYRSGVDVVSCATTPARIPSVSATATSASPAVTA